MVVARNQDTASYLCRAWRERESVQKVYLAHVRHWPPYHQHGMSEGAIDLALAPSRNERIKWEVTPVEEGGKECQTFWKVFEDFDEDCSTVNSKRTSHNNMHDHCLKGITLELHPLTGRTHQLRIHCAAVGSGIVGDSLYGDSPIAWIGADLSTTESGDEPNGVSTSSKSNDPVKTLRLHAHRLSFPTKTGQKMTFESPKSW
jgi:23S rRNA-/tRNA-specific pseudouridylate synthase